MKRREKLKDVMEYIKKHKEMEKIKAFGELFGMSERGQELLDELNEWLDEEIEK
jgi:hypothetical protein